MTTTFEEKDGILHVRGEWHFQKKWIHPEEYERFRKAASSIANPEARRVLLEGI